MSNPTPTLTVADLYPARLERLRTASGRLDGWRSAHEVDLLELLLLTVPRLRRVLQAEVQPRGVRLPKCTMHPADDAGDAEVTVVHMEEVRAYDWGGRPRGYTEEATEMPTDFSELEAVLLAAPDELVVNLDALAGAPVRLPVD